MKAADLNFVSMRHFAKSEWPGDVLEHMDAEVVKALVTVRNQLLSDHGWAPSALERGHVRHENGELRVQPTGAHDAYDGKTWESDIDANVWEPPEQWSEV